MQWDSFKIHFKMKSSLIEKYDYIIKECYLSSQLYKITFSETTPVSAQVTFGYSPLPPA